MALKPVLKLKVDELFLRWLSEPDTQSALRGNLRQIVRGEAVSAAPARFPPHHHPGAPASPCAARAHTHHAHSPSGGAAHATPPASPMTASPRSPRRPVVNKASIKQLNYKQVSREDLGQKARGEPDGQADSFLRQKEAQLREKREREKLEKSKAASGGGGDGEKVSVVNRTNKPEIINDTSHHGNNVNNSVLGNAVNNRLDNKRRKDPAPSAPVSMGTDYKGYLQDKAQAEQPKQQQQVQYVNKSKSESAAQIVEVNKQLSQAQLAQQQQQQQQPNRTNVTNNKNLVQQQQQQQNKSLLSDKKQAPDVVAKDNSRPGSGTSASKKPGNYGNKPVVKDLSKHIPQFYFPMGQPPGIPGENDVILQRIKEAFSGVEGGKATRVQMGNISKACGLPTFWKGAFHHATANDKSGHVTLQSFLALWRKLVANCHDDASKFVRLLAKPGCPHLLAEDFIPLIQDVVDTHPGLTFLQDAPEFHSRYVHTVIARIFYCVNRSWSGRITVPELRRSNFLQTLALLDDEDDINQVMDFFSYEHFYVIYCKFWELDKDHDLFISKDDLARHNDHAICTKMIERVFSGAVTRGRAQKEGKMSYTEFVWFLMSEEDKRSPTSIEYWFRCMDVDGDGVISMYEMEYFYDEMVQRMEALGIETLPFEDCLCQMLDMVKPRKDGYVTLSDLRACKMTPLYFDTFFNLEKYLEHEQKDPFANVKDVDEPEMSDWERYAAEEYEILVAEEGAGELGGDDISYEDDFEQDDESPAPTPPQGEEESGGPGERPGEPRPGAPGKKPGAAGTGEDIYDFTPSDLGY